MGPLMRIMLGWSCFAVLAVLAGCDGSGGGGGAVGAAGGTVECADGRARAEVPPGALDGPVRIVIAPASGTPTDARVLGSTAHSFGPDGTAFQWPVRLSISYDPAEIPAQFTEADLRLCKLVGGAWTGLVDSHVDAAANLVYGHAESFSTYAVGALAAGRSLVVEDTWDAAASRPVDVALWSDAPPLEDNWAFVGLEDLPYVGILTRTPSHLDQVASIEAFGNASRVAFENEGRPAPGWPADAAQHALCWIDPTNCRVGYSVFVLRDSEQVGEIYDVQPWGEPGSGPGQFLNPGGLDFGRQSHLFIADTGNRRVQEFDVEGNFVRQYGPQTGKPDMPELLEPTDVACCGPWLLVVDRGHHCVWLYELGTGRVLPYGAMGKWSDGKVTWRGGYFRGRTVAGDEPGAFNAPTAIGASPDGRSFCVADTGNERVQMFSGFLVLSALTAAELSVPAPSGFTGITIGGSGRVYLADPARNRVVVLRVQEAPL